MREGARFCAQCGTQLPVAPPPAEAPTVVADAPAAPASPTAPVAPEPAGDDAAPTLVTTPDADDTTVDDAATTVLPSAESEGPAEPDESKTTIMQPVAEVQDAPEQDAPEQAAAEQVAQDTPEAAEPAVPEQVTPEQVTPEQVAPDMPTAAEPATAPVAAPAAGPQTTGPQMAGNAMGGAVPPQMPPAQPMQTPTINTQAITSNRMVRELTAPAVLQTAGVSLGIGVGAAIVLALINAIICTAAMGQVSSELGGVSSLMSSIGMGSFTSLFSGLNFLQLLVMSLVMGVSGSFSLGASAAGISLDSMAHISLATPLGLSGLALMIGAAFGAYLFARKHAVRFAWTGAISAAAVGLACAIVYVVLAAIFPLSVSASSGGYGASASLSGATFRTFLMTFLIAGLGALAGYALAQYAPDSSNVFLAAWRWMHRTRGFVRTVAESVMVYSVVFTAVGIIALVVSAISNKAPGTLLLILMLFPFLPIAFFVVGALGSVDVVVTGQQQTASISAYAPNVSDGRWMLILLVVVFVVATFYIALRASARNMYDRAYADWKHSWKSPVVAVVAWLIMSLSFVSWNVTAAIASQGSYAMTFGPAMWFFLVAAIWAFLIEVVALTFGPSLVVSMPGLWKCFVGGTVQATPQNVRDYVAACSAKAPAAPAATATATAATAAASPADAAAPGTMPTNATPNDAASSGVSAAAVGAAAGVAAMGVAGAAIMNANGDQPAETAQSSVDTATTPIDVSAVQQAPTAPIPTAVQTSEHQQDSQTPQPAPFTQTAQVPTGAVQQTFTPQPAPTYQSISDQQAAAGGAQVPPAIPPSIPPAAPQGKPLSAKQKTGIIIGAVVVGVAILLGIAYAVLNATVFNPQSVADRYVAALASGNYDEANSIADPQIDQAQRVLLTKQAAQAENATITNARVTGIADNADGSKSVSVSYTISGNTVNDTFTMASTGSNFLVFPDWNVTTPLLKEIQVTADSAISEISINGIEVTEENAVSGSLDSGLVFKVYPGTYRVAAAESDFIATEPITVNTYDTSYAYIDAEPTDALTEAIQSEIDAQLQVCAASTEAEPEGCPFGKYVYLKDRYRNFAWSITESPVIDYVDLSSGMFSASVGEAEVTYEYRINDDTWEPEDSTDFFYLDGTFAIEGDQVTVTINQY